MKKMLSNMAKHKSPGMPMGENIGMKRTHTAAQRGGKVSKQARPAQTYAAGKNQY